MGQLSKLIFQRLGPGYFIGSHNEMAKSLKSTGGGVNDGIGLETVAESGCIGVSGADEYWLLLVEVAERVPGRVRRDDMWQMGQDIIFWLRSGSRDCVTGGVCLKVCSAEVVAVVRPHYLAGGSRQG